MELKIIRWSSCECKKSMFITEHRRWFCNFAHKSRNHKVQYQRWIFNFLQNHCIPLRDYKAKKQPHHLYTIFNKTTHQQKVLKRDVIFLLLLWDGKIEKMGEMSEEFSHTRVRQWIEYFKGTIKLQIHRMKIPSSRLPMRKVLICEGKKWE